MSSQRRARVAAGLVATALVLGASGAQLASARNAQTTRLVHQTRSDVQLALRRIAALRAETSRWLRLTGVPTPSPDSRSLAAVASLQAEVVVWERRVAAARNRALHPPHLHDWLCIHRFEGVWAAHTGNGYYGGLQMDIEFQRAFGARLLQAKGTADRWTPLEQIWVAERARSSGLGFAPWPVTSRLCGLR